MNLRKERILLLLGLTIVVSISSCQRSERVKAYSEGEVQKLESGTLDDQSGDFNTARKDMVERRINESLTTIEDRVDELDGKIDRSSAKLSREARLKSDKLKNDLMRIEQNLKITLDSIENASEENFSMSREALQQRLDKTEDEISQINEELQEWYDNNFN